MRERICSNFFFSFFFLFIFSHLTSIYKWHSIEHLIQWFAESACLRIKWIFEKKMNIYIENEKSFNSKKFNNWIIIVCNNQINIAVTSKKNRFSALKLNRKQILDFKSMQLSPFSDLQTDSSDPIKLFMWF